MPIRRFLILIAAASGMLPSSPGVAGGQFHVHEPARKAVKTVAVLPMRTDPAILDAIDGAEQVIARIEDGVVKRFRDAGYTVVEPARFKDFWEVEQPRAGAMYHPFTGDLNVEVYNKVRGNTLRRLAETYPHDAIIELSFLTQYADMDEGLIEWDDVSESAAGYSAVGDFLTGDNRNNEMLQVLSLQVVFRDRRGDAMYTGKGGLQPLQRSPFFGSFYNLKSVPMFNDPRRESRAIDMALGPWLMTPKEFKAAQKKAHGRLPLPKATKREPGPPPFDRNAFFASKPTIAIAPIVLPDFGGDAGAVRLRYNQMTGNMLRKLGYKVVPPIEFMRAWDRAITHSMGLYDELTGRAVPGARDQMMYQVMDELRAKHGVDALLTSTVTRRMVNFTSGYAHWDGLQSITVPGAQLGNVNRLGNSFGVVPAISVNVSLLDGNGNRMVGGAGGIQIIQRFTQGQFVNISESEWFSDDKANALAIWLALRPLDESEKDKKAAAKAAEKSAAKK